MLLQELITRVHEWAKGKGWWDDPNRPVGDIHALFHSEVTESFEEYRKFGMDRERFIYFEIDERGVDKPEGIAVELADLVIRVADFCGRYDIPLERAIEIKMDYNQSRPYRHGNKHA